MPLITHTVTCRTEYPGGEPLEGTWSVSVYATPPLIRDLEDHEIITGKRPQITSEGLAVLVLEETGQPNLEPDDFRWQISFVSQDKQVRLGPYVFELTADRTLDEIAESSGVPITSSILAQAQASAASAVAAAAAAAASATAAEGSAAPAWTRDAGDTYRDATRRLRFTDLTSSLESVINIQHNANGALDGTKYPYGLEIHNNDGAKPAIVIHQYSNNGPAFQIDNTDNQVGIVVNNTQNLVRNPDGDGTGDFVKFQDHGVEVIKWATTNVITSNRSLVLLNNTAGPILYPQTVTAGIDVLKLRTGGGNYITLTDGTLTHTLSKDMVWNLGAKTFTLLNNNTGQKILDLQTASDLVGMRILSSAATATQPALDIDRRGSASRALLVRNNTANQFGVDVNGIPEWLAASNAQTTVGAAGGASAPPATPTKWLKVKDPSGTVGVIPWYAAA